MARIRSIKPEFPQSESMGRVSRDARLTFIELWTIADDEGRLRGHSRMLASLLFPYDDDSGALIDSWLAELEREKCVIRYPVEGTSYIQICNWLTHQKIDKPSKSKIPPPPDSLANPRESSRAFPQPSEVPREHSSEDLRIKDQGREGIKDTEDSRVVSMTREGEMSAALRKLNVTVTSIHPTLVAWVRDGFTVAQVCEAVEVARKSKPDGSIPPNYLDRILREPARPPPKSAADRVTWRPPPDEVA